MISFWDERYKDSDYAYGISPNSFFKNELSKLEKGNLLLPLEGEGRNAVHAASLGWKITAFDYSLEGKKKAELLAKNQNVSIEYTISSIEEYKNKKQFDCIGLFYTHLPLSSKTFLYELIQRNLKKGGVLLMEVFSENQLGKPSGGPKSKELLFTIEELKNHFKGFQKVSIWEEEIVLNEGPFHQGDARVIRVIATK